MKCNLDQNDAFSTGAILFVCAACVCTAKLYLI